MLAIIETGGKQFKVQEGSEIFIEKINVLPGEKYEFRKIIAVDQEIGNPFLSNFKVIGEIVKHGKQKKIHVVKFQRRKRLLKKQGHRQNYTKVLITQIIKN